MEKLNFDTPGLNGLKEKWQREQREKESGLTQKQIKHLRADEYCKSMNDDMGDLSFGDCKVCKNKGAIYYLDGLDNLCVKDCECLKARKSRQLIEYSGLRNLIDKCTFDSYNALATWQKAVKQKAAEYLKANKEWFLIVGQSGTGKSHLCTAIVGELLKQGKQVIFISYIKHIPELKQLTLDADKYNDLLNSWLKCEVLYIDDLFKLKVNEVDKSIILRIINYRVINDLKTIISSEMLINDMISVDEATIGRMREKCGKYVVEIQKDINKNYRLKG